VHLTPHRTRCSALPGWLPCLQVEVKLHEANEQHVSNIMWSLSKLGHLPEGGVLGALMARSVCPAV
jgi:hypothetical protein